MLNTLTIALIVGTILGFLAGLGAGGGSLFILWLTLVLDTEQNIARVMNLLFFLPTALISSFFRWKYGKLNLRKILPGIISGCISAAVFSVLSRYLELKFLQKLFGILLLITGVKELMYRPKH